MSRILLCVDLSNQVYKAAAVHPTLQSEGRFTGGLYGFLVVLSKAILFTKATEVILCKDSKPYIRSRAYPEYKAIRATTKDEDLVLRAKETMAQVDELVAEIDLPVWEVPGFESDDLVAHAVARLRHRYDRIIAASNDSDLYQLLKHQQFAIWKGKKGLYERSDFDKEFPGITPEDFITLLALTGTHNEVAGIPGVGPVTALNAIKKPEVLRKLRQQHSALIERNLGLITLPHPEMPASCIPKKIDPFKPRQFIRFCGRYDIDATGAMIDALTQLE